MFFSVICFINFVFDLRYGFLKNECLVVNNNFEIMFLNIKFGF